jgi:hypothetical protein
MLLIRVTTKLPNSEQSSKGKVETHKYINRQISQQPENCENRNDPDLVQPFLKKGWVESDFKAPPLEDCSEFGNFVVTLISNIATASETFTKSVQFVLKHQL